MKVNVYLKNLKNGEEISYGEMWNGVHKKNATRFKNITIEEKVNLTQKIVDELNKLVKKRYWGKKPEFVYYLKGE